MRRAEPSTSRASSRPGPRPAGRLAALLLALAATPGCSTPQRARLDDCRKLSQALQADNGRLKDVALKLRNQNEDLSQRAVADARRIRELAEVRDQLERNIAGYQEDRERMAAAYRRIVRQVGAAAASAAAPPPEAVLDRLAALSRGRPGLRFDRESSTLALDADGLFEPGEAEPTDEGRTALEALAGVLDAPEAGQLALEVVGLGPATAERPASLESGVEADSPAARLGLARAARVREALAAGGRVDPSRVSVAGAEGPAGSGPRVEVRLAGSPTAAFAGP